MIKSILKRLKDSEVKYDETALDEMNRNGHTLDFEHARGKKVAMKEAIEIVHEVIDECSNAVGNELMVITALPSLYPLQSFEEEAIHKVVSAIKECSYSAILDFLQFVRDNAGREELNNKDGWALSDLIILAEEFTPYRRNDGWIYVSEKLPEEPGCGLEDMNEFPEYNVVIKGAETPTTLHYAGDGEWYRDGMFYEVVAWQPLPVWYPSKES